MILLDRIVSVDAASKQLTAEMTARPEWSENWAAVEYMAQAAAALAGLMDISEGEKGPPKLGFLLGSRKLELLADRFEPGRKYLVDARNEFSDSEAASFECAVREAGEGGRTVAKAMLSAYRPRDLESFINDIKERKQ